MKTRIFVLWLLLIAGAAWGQEATIPEGNCRIMLKNGRKIEGVIIRSADSLKIAYIKDGSLHDLRSDKLSSIETKYYYLYFDTSNHLKKKQYDQLILTNRDTLYGIIKNVNKNVITIFLPNKNKEKKIRKENVSTYTLGNPVEVTAEPPMPEPAIADTIIATIVNPDPVPLPEPDIADTITATIVHPDPVPPVIPANGSDNGSDYYIDSYDLGVQMADTVNVGGYGIGAFLTGLIYGSPYVTSGALAKKVDIRKVPPGVDATLYQEGYKNNLVNRRAKSAATGATAGKLTITALILLLIVIAW